MIGGANLAALLALVPAMTGPLPVEQGSRALVLALCGGGHIALAVDRGERNAPPQAVTPCCAKGCRTDDTKKKGRAQKTAS